MFVYEAVHGIHVYVFDDHFRFVLSLTYYGLTLNVGNLAGNKYVNMGLYGLVEMISYITCLLLIDNIGRRPLTAGMLILSGLTCSATIFPVLFATKGVYHLL